MANFNDALYNIQRHYFQTLTMKSFEWKKYLTHLQNDESVCIEQKAILSATVLHSLSKNYPPSISYRLSFLKSLLAVYEEHSCDVCDELYTLMAELISKKKTSEDDFSYKSYILPCGQAVTLGESTQFLSQGTTGLNTWQAGLYLSNWLIQNISVLQEKNILELGSGTGLTGLVALHCCRPKTYAFTDCHENVLNNIKRNLQINGIRPVETRNASEQCENDDNKTYFEEKAPVLAEFRNFLSAQSHETCKRCRTNETSSRLKKTSAVVCQLDWGNFSKTEIQEHTPDVILAADVIFDPKLIEPLANVIKILLSRTSKDLQPVAFIASTIRNNKTYEQFLLTLSKFGIRNEHINVISENFIDYENFSEIVLLRLEI